MTTEEKYESNTLNDAYFDKNQAVMLLTKMAEQLGFTVGIKDNAAWPILFIDTDYGQLSWHIPKDELVGTYQQFPREWDEHSLKEKRNRIHLLLNERW